MLQALADWLMGRALSILWDQPVIQHGLLGDIAVLADINAANNLACGWFQQMVSEVCSLLKSLQILDQTGLVVSQCQVVFWPYHAQILPQPLSSAAKAQSARSPHGWLVRPDPQKPGKPRQAIFGQAIKPVGHQRANGGRLLAQRVG